MPAGILAMRAVVACSYRPDGPAGGMGTATTSPVCPHHFWSIRGSVDVLASTRPGKPGVIEEIAAGWFAVPGIRTEAVA